jgi:hypothetical protein
MKLRPLEQFICDECGELIEKPEDGWLEWIDDCKNPIHGFRIVHADGASPRRNSGKNCYYPESSDISDMHLASFSKIDGLAILLSFFERNLGTPKQLAEIIRRLHIPHYEEARRYLERATSDCFIDNIDSSQTDLKRVIEEYGNDRT